VRLVTASALLFALVLALGFAVNASWFVGFDATLSHALNLRRGPSSEWLVVLMQAISWIGGGAQRFGIVLVLVLIVSRWWGLRAGVVIALAALLSELTSEWLKIFFGRARPDLVTHLDIVHSPAFPSGHATNAAVVYILLIMLVPPARHRLWYALAAIMIVLTGVSRIMLGVHWPTDVIGGWMLGTAFALAAAAVVATADSRKGSAPLH